MLLNVNQRLNVLGEHIRSARLPRSQEWLAAKLDVSQRTISHWERGESHPGPDHIQQLEEALDMEVGSLMAVYYRMNPEALARAGADVSELLSVVKRIRRQVDRLESMLRAVDQ